MKIRILTAGESHGKLLNALVDGIPSGFSLSKEYINYHLQRRKKGYGRGGRMQIEADNVEIYSGVRHGYTIGSPISLNIHNKDWENWKTVMALEPVDFNDPEVLEKLNEKKIEYVRPGHADLIGTLKYNHNEVRNVLERSSARETAARVAACSICRKFLEELGIKIFSHVQKIASASVDIYAMPEDLDEASRLAEESILRCIDKDVEKQMIAEIDKAKENGDTLGGTIQIIATGVPLGLGSYTQWDRKLDAAIAHAVMSIPAIKAVSIGLGNKVAELPGSMVHDEIFPKNEDGDYVRKTNNSGGIEGGMSTGMPIVVNASMKPIPTLKKPLRSINIETGEQRVAHYERSDVCAVPAAGVVCESMLAHVLANAILEKFGGDSIDEVKNNLEAFKSLYKKR